MPANSLQIDSTHASKSTRTAARNRLSVITYVILTAFAAVLPHAGCDAPAPAAVDIDTAAELKSLRDLIPDQAHILADVGYHFTNLWFAGDAENWPLADFYLSETKSHLRWAVRAKPIRKDNAGRDIKLVAILEAFENSQLGQLKKTIDGKDKPEFITAYKAILTTCYACHKASDKPYLRPQIPKKADAGLINIDPKADWPL